MNETDRICDAIIAMDLPNLRRVSAAVKHAYDMQARKARAQLFPGDRVWFNTRQGVRIEGNIAKINPKSIQLVNCSDGQRWKVAPQLLNRIP
jgi:hypothetical protein